MKSKTQFHYKHGPDTKSHTKPSVPSVLSFLSLSPKRNICLILRIQWATSFNKSNEVRLQPKSYLFYRIRSFGHVLKLYVCANGKTGHSKKIFSAYCRNSNAVKVFLQSLRVRHSFRNTDII